MAFANHPLTEFTLFPLLPQELRIQIWTHAVSAHSTSTPPRLLTLRCPTLPSPGPVTCVSSEKSTGDLSFFSSPSLRRTNPYAPPAPDAPPGPDLCRGFTSPCPIPSLLFVNKESHSISLTTYEKAFGTTYSSANIWADFDHDILFLTWGLESGGTLYDVDQLETLRDEDLDRISSLAIHIKNSEGQPGLEDWIAMLMQWFAHVKTVYLVDRLPMTREGDLMFGKALGDLEVRGHEGTYVAPDRRAYKAFDQEKFRGNWERDVQRAKEGGYVEWELPVVREHCVVGRKGDLGYEVGT
ncbi:uncharacterized protein PAC_00799 [Phialocephala subalpina]|uniref:2EXR domain-containing protein n=1 Tax=Phialocephala subalpina TaxID=576137 RepID=A0A1L7WDR3_9HELO|nr:uncharacterized protein PAC_00799 [Phialocephala subalpina]